jgi:hypothetical protein
MGFKIVEIPPPDLVQAQDTVDVPSPAGSIEGPAGERTERMVAKERVDTASSLLSARENPYVRLARRIEEERVEAASSWSATVLSVAIRPSEILILRASILNSWHACLCFESISTACCKQTYERKVGPLETCYNQRLVGGLKTLMNPVSTHNASVYVDDRACSMCDTVCEWHTNTHQRYRDDVTFVRKRNARTHTTPPLLHSPAKQPAHFRRACHDGGDLTEFVVCSGLVTGCVGANLKQPVVDALSRNVLVARTLRPFVDKAGEMTGSACMSLTDFTA